MCNNEIFEFIKIYSESTCATYGGVRTGDACCASSCGTCGGALVVSQGTFCGARPGGFDNCCISGIPSQQVCGPDQDAPCFLEKGK